MEDFVRTLKTSEAASVLNVSPNTLRAWERRFGYPKPQRTAAMAAELYVGTGAVRVARKGY